MQPWRSSSQGFHSEVHAGVPRTAARDHAGTSWRTCTALRMVSAVAQPVFTKRGARGPDRAILADLLSPSLGASFASGCCLPWSRQLWAAVTSLVKRMCSFCLLLLFCLWPQQAGSLFPDRGSNLCSLPSKRRALAAGPPGRYPRILWF